MLEFMLVLIVCVALALLGWFVFMQKKSRPRGHDLYICPFCGERNCHCHKEDHAA